MAAEQVERNQRAKKHVDGHRTKWFSEDQKSYNFADIQREEAKTAAKTAELLATERLIFELQVEDAAAEKRRRHKKKKRGTVAVVLARTTRKIVAVMVWALALARS